MRPSQQVIGRGETGIEDDEIITAIIEGIIGAHAEAVFKHFFAVAGIGGRGAALGEDAVEIVIADGVMEWGFDGVFGALIEIEKHAGASAAGAERVENQISPADGKFGFGCGDFCEGHLAAVRGIEFGLDVGIGEEGGIPGGGGLRFHGLPPSPEMVFVMP